MAIGDTRLPEGTDSIIGGASVRTDFSSTGGLSSTAPGFDNSPAASKATTAPSDTLNGAKAKVADKASELRDQAADKMKVYALQGKDKAVEGLDSVQRLIEDAADTVDAKIGAEYGAYVRQAGASVASFSDAVRDKDVDQLLVDARDLVRQSPALAIGAATAIGFLIARVAKAGLGTPVTGQAPVMGGSTPIAPSTAPTTPVGSRPTV